MPTQPFFSVLGLLFYKKELYGKKGKTCKIQLRDI